MGKVLADITITNRADQVLAENGHLETSKIRSVKLKSVMLETGATTLCLPRVFVEELGLKLLKEVNVGTTTGYSTMRVYKDACLILGEREGTFECVELPNGTQPLVGVIPLEALGIELDLQKQKIIVLPDHGPKSYITAY